MKRLEILNLRCLCYDLSTISGVTAMTSGNEIMAAAGSRRSMLPRSIGVLLAAFGSLLCWAGLIGIFQAIN